MTTTNPDLVEHGPDGKPVNITQDAWDAAENAVAAMCALHPYASRPAWNSIVARAIDEATAVARDNFLTMQGTAARLLEDANRYKDAAAKNLERSLATAARIEELEQALRQSFQDRVALAHVALFHDDPTDLAERRDRFYEEATETVQSLGITADEAHQLVEYTFGRAPGDVRKEIGAAALTLASLCVVGGWDMMECAEADLAQLETPEKIAKVRAKRATRHGRGPLPGLSATSTLGAS